MLKHLQPFHVLLTIFGLFSLNLGNAQALQPTTYITDGTVNTSVVSGANLFIGGNFSYAGPYTGAAAAIDAASGAVDLSFPIVEGSGADINAIVPDGAGGWFIGGNFTLVGGSAHLNLAHIKSDKTVDAGWSASANGPVNSLALSGGTLYVGGSFNTINSTTRNRVAALNASDGSLIVGWNANAAGGIGATVLAIAASGSNVYLGGTFTTVGGTARNFLAKVDNTTGALDATWNPSPNSKVNALVVSGTSVYAGGFFDKIGVTTINHIAKISGTGSGSLDPTWDADANGPVTALAISGSILYAGGEFTTMGGLTRKYLAAVDAGGVGAVKGWDPGADNFVNAIATDGTTVFAGGDFSQVGGLTRNYLAAIDASTGSIDAWDPHANSSVEALSINGTTVLAGGIFNSVGGKTRSNVASFDVSTGALTAWDPQTNGTVSALAVSGSTVYIGGTFSLINGGTVSNNLASVDASTGVVDPTWTPNPNGPIYSLVSSGGTLYVGGGFNTIGAMARNNIAALNSSGVPTTWNPNITGGSVLSLAAAGANVYAGGSFNSVGGTTRNNIALINAASGIPDASWDPNLDGAVKSIALSGGTVYVGGLFANIGATPRNTLGAIDAGGLATVWNPNPTGGTITNAIAIDGTNIYVGGDFTQVGSSPRDGLALIDASGAGTVSAWNANPQSTIDDGGGYIFNTLSISGSSIFAGGSFSTIQNTYRTNLASFSITPPIVLPVRLVSFTATNQDANDALIEWKTATEDPHTTYSLLRSTDAIHFKSIYTTSTISGLESGNPYKYIDTLPESGTYYYELEIKEPSGSRSYSSIRRVTVGLPSGIKVIAPLGATIITVVSPSNYVFQLSTSNGVIVKSVVLEAGNNYIATPGEKGIYFYSILDKGRLVKSGKYVN